MGEEFLNQTAEFWQAKASRQVSCEDARQIVENVTGFFDLLLKWEDQENSTISPDGNASPKMEKRGPQQ